MTMDREGPAAAEPTRDPTPRGPVVRVDMGEQGHHVWPRLRDLWLANAVLAQRGTDEAAAYQWDASKFVPVLQLDAEGDPQMLFANAGERA